MKMKSESEVAQSCLTLSDPLDCSPPGSSVHGIFQARVLEWGAIALASELIYIYIVSPSQCIVSGRQRLRRMRGETETKRESERGKGRKRYRRKKGETKKDRTLFDVLNYPLDELKSHQ